MSSEGPATPRWTGKPLTNATIEGYLLPWHAGQPLFIQVKGCEDFFLPIFSTIEKLHEAVNFLISTNVIPPTPYSVKCVTGQTDFLISIFEGGVRVMVDPQIINENHTRWMEVVFQGDEYKLMADESDEGD